MDIIETKLLRKIEGIKVINLSKVSLGEKLIHAIYNTCYELDVNHVVVNKASFNKYAVCELYNNNDCIEWNYEILLF